MCLCVYVPVGDHSEEGGEEVEGEGGVQEREGEGEGKGEEKPKQVLVPYSAKFATWTWWQKFNLLNLTQVQFIAIIITLHTCVDSGGIRI